MRLLGSGVLGIQVVQGVHELHGHQLWVGSAELEEVEAARGLTLREPDEMDALDVLIRHSIKQAFDGIPVRVEEGEAAAGRHVVGREGHELRALARAGAPDEGGMAQEDLVWQVHDALSLPTDAPFAGEQPGWGGQLATMQHLHRPGLVRMHRRAPQLGDGIGAGDDGAPGVSDPGAMRALACRPTSARRTP